MARGEQIEEAGRWLASVGGSATPGEIGTALGLTNRQRQAEVIRALREAGLVDGPKGRVTLTVSGWARFGVAEPIGAGAALDAAVAGWPYAHAAHVRLMVSATISRIHLGAVRPSGHLGFMAMGETGTGKSSPVEHVVCPLLGLDPADVVREVPAETPGGIRGRHRDDGNGYQLVTAAPTPAVVLFDEFDKGDEQVRRAVWPHFQGKTTVMIEGTAYDRPSTPALAANPPRVRGSIPAPGDAARYALLRPEYRRRSVLLDTGYMHGRRAEIDAAVRTANASPVPAGRLSLERLIPPATALDGRALAVLDQLRDVLTEEGNDIYDVPGLELAALGRAALLGSGDLTLAAYATGTDYLLVTGTVPGLVAPDWHVQLEALRCACLDGAEVDQFAALISQAHAEADRQRNRARTAITRKEHEDVELIAERAGLAERLRLAADHIDGRRLAVLTDAQRADAKGVRAALLSIRDRVNDSRSPVRLAECAQLAAEPLDLAATITDQAKAEQQRRTREAAQAVEQLRNDTAERSRRTKAIAQQRRAEHVHLADVLDTVTTTARQLEKLYARTGTPRDGRTPLAELSAVRVDGRALITYQSPPTELGGGFWAGLGRAMAGPTAGTWHVLCSEVTFPGFPEQCTALDTWGPNTRAVLVPVLAHLHDVEDQYRYRLGKQARKARPHITAPRPRAVQKMPSRTALPAGTTPQRRAVRDYFPGAPNNPY